MEELTTKQKVISLFLEFAFKGTPLFIGIALGELLSMLMLFGIFIVINIIINKFNLKIHAEISKDGDEWKDIAACYFTSNGLLLVCLLIMRFSGHFIPLWQIMLLGVIAVGVSTVIVSNVFYTKSKNENIETKKSLRDELAKMSKAQAKEYLYERLPEDEADAVFWLDWQCKPLGFVAFNKINISETALKELRSSAYHRLRAINSTIDA